MTPTHVPVMVEEVLGVLPLGPGAVAVDGTLGLAGHALEMARRIAPGGLIVATDWDKEMLERGTARLMEVPAVDVRTYHTDYRRIPEHLRAACLETGREPAADGVLLDMGLNNAQIEDPSRGVSFLAEGPLDMRMDRTQGEPAASMLNRLSPREIEQILWELGDERWAKRIAQVIVERRKTKPLKTTTDLVDCVLAAVPAAKRDKRLHPATRTFMGLRIAVNHELDDLDEALRKIADVLRRGGVLAVLAYHSGEDRAVKRAFRGLSATGDYEELTKKPVGPSPAEVAANPKSRSAKMRALRRVS